MGGKARVEELSYERGEGRGNRRGAAQVRDESDKQQVLDGALRAGQGEVGGLRSGRGSGWGATTSSRPD